VAREQGSGKRTSDQVEEHIIRAILDGTFPPGSALPGERDLARQFGVARPTLREALQRLARDGWITIRHGQPASVNYFWREGNLNVLDRLVQHAEHLSPDFITQLLEVRAALAPAFSRAAVARHPAKVVAALAGSEDLDDDPAAYAAFDWELQRTLALLSDNPVFLLMLNGCSTLYARAAHQYFARAENRTASRNFYHRLLNAAMACDPDRAATAVSEAMLESITLWQATVRTQPPEASRITGLQVEGGGHP